MKFIITLLVLGLIAFALYQKWRRISPQTKQMWLMLFGAAKVMRQAKKQMKEQASQTSAPVGGAPFDFSYNAQPSTASTEKSVYKMQACHQCGLHIPENEGVMVRGQFYCCKEHAQ